MGYCSKTRTYGTFFIDHSHRILFIKLTLQKHPNTMYILFIVYGVVYYEFNGASLFSSAEGCTALALITSPALTHASRHPLSWFQRKTAYRKLKLTFLLSHTFVLPVTTEQHQPHSLSDSELYESLTLMNR